MPEQRLAKTRAVYRSQPQYALTFPGVLDEHRRRQIEDLWHDGVPLQTIADAFGGEVKTLAQAGLSDA